MFLQTFLNILVISTICLAVKLRCSQDTLKHNPLNCKVNCLDNEDKTALEFGRTYPEVLFLFITYCDLDTFPDQIAKDFPKLKIFNIFNNPSSMELDNFIASPKLDQFWMSNSSVSTIKDNTFANSSQLITLIMLNGNLDSVQPDAFVGLVNLINLELSESWLVDLDKSVFKPLKALAFLSLKKNRIQNIHEELFKSNLKLVDINLSFNEISFLDENTFENLPNLVLINLCRNNLKVFTANVKNVLIADNLLNSVFIGDKTRLLLMENNAIEHINCTEKELQMERLIATKNLLTNLNCIDRMSNLTKLHLSKNNFSEFSEKSLENLKKLQELDITENENLNLNLEVFVPYVKTLKVLKIEELPDYTDVRKLLPELLFLSLSTRDWNCTYLSFVFDTLNDQQISLRFNQLGDEDVFCPSNHHINSKSWTEKII